MTGRKKTKAFSGKNSWKMNLIFVLVVLAAAAALYYWTRPAATPDRDSTMAETTTLEAVIDFGDGISETVALDQDHDYLYDVDGTIVHLQVLDGAIAFMDSQCPDHVCEQFGWLSQEGAWAACVPAGVYVIVQQPEG